MQGVKNKEFDDYVVFDMKAFETFAVGDADRYGQDNFEHLVGKYIQDPPHPP